MDVSGCGAAWLARLLGVQEVPSSNLGSPTKFFKGLQAKAGLYANCGGKPQSQTWLYANCGGKPQSQTFLRT
jgi:hypothetical protein